MRVVLLVAALVACSLAATTHTITVGGGASLVFAPSTLNIAKGDSVIFNFAGGNHTVTESAAAESCTASPDFSGQGFVRLTATNTAGFLFANAGVFTYFCEPHCSQGMFGEIIIQDRFCAFPNIAQDVCFEYDVEKVKTGENCGLCAATEAGKDPTLFVCDAKTDVCDDDDKCHPYVLVPAEQPCCQDEDTCSTLRFCFDEVYETTCLGNDICGAPDVLSPGQTCSVTDLPRYDGDGCAHGSCDSTTNTCPSVATGGSCTSNSDCLASDYCAGSGGNSTCATRVATGSNCNRDSDCVQTDVCVDQGGSSSICVTMFSLAAGARCDGEDTACAPGLVCAKQVGGDLVCHDPKPFEGLPCTPDGTQCGIGGAACVCDGDKGTFSCVVGALFTQSFANDWLNAARCANTNGCPSPNQMFFESSEYYYFTGGCAQTSCSGSFDPVGKAEQSFIRNALQSGGGNSAQSVVVAVALVVAALAAAL